jgi:hypothetical protein
MLNPFWQAHTTILTASGSALCSCRITTERVSGDICTVCQHTITRYVDILDHHGCLVEGVPYNFLSHRNAARSQNAIIITSHMRRGTSSWTCRNRVVESLTLGQRCDTTLIHYILERACCIWHDGIEWRVLTKWLSMKGRQPQMAKALLPYAYTDRD